MLDKLKKLKNLNLINYFKLDRWGRQAIFVVGIAVFIVANLLLSTIPLRLDLSKGQAYTLTPATKKILNNLDDIVNIKLYVSSDLPTRMQPLKTEVTDLLTEYDRYNKVQVKILDPKTDQVAAAEAQNSGIPQLQFSQLESDKYAVSAAYFGMAVGYGNKKEIIPQATDPQSLEYNLSAAIYKVTKKELPQIGLIGADEQVSVNALQQLLSQQFTVNTITLATGEAEQIDQDNKSIMVIANPNKPLEDLEIQAIKQYLAKKGSAIFFVNGEDVTDGLQTQPAQPQLLSLIKDYGIQVNQDLVLSGSAELVNFGSDVESMVTLYPFWVKTNLFNPESGYFSNISVLTYPWASTLSLVNKPGITTKELVRTTPQSWVQTGTFELNPQSIPEPTQKDLKQHVLTAQAEKKDGGKILVIGTNRFAQDRYLGPQSANVELVLNVLNDFASGGSLSGIRQRAVSTYPIPTLPDTFKNIFKYGNILLLPVLFAIYGLVKIMRRK